LALGNWKDQENFNDSTGGKRGERDVYWGKPSPGTKPANGVKTAPSLVWNGQRKGRTWVAGRVKQPKKWCPKQEVAGDAKPLVIRAAKEF